MKIEVENGPKQGGRPKLQRGPTQRFNEAMSEAYKQVRSARVMRGCGDGGKGKEVY